jgi:GNAT superfamily N-acetyltransferase
MRFSARCTNKAAARRLLQSRWTPCALVAARRGTGPVCPPRTTSYHAVLVRAEAPDDVDAVAAVTAAAFGKEREAGMIDAIRASDRFVPELSLFADDDGEIVGHVMLSYVDLDGRRVLELGPMSVTPKRQRQGIGGSLIREALRLANERGEPLVLGSDTRRTTRASAFALPQSSVSSPRLVCRVLHGGAAGRL